MNLKISIHLISIPLPHKKCKDIYKMNTSACYVEPARAMAY